MPTTPLEMSAASPVSTTTISVRSLPGWAAGQQTEWSLVTPGLAAALGSPSEVNPDGTCQSDASDQSTRSSPDRGARPPAGSAAVTVRLRSLGDAGPGATPSMSQATGRQPRRLPLAWLVHAGLPQPGSLSGTVPGPHEGLPAGPRKRCSEHWHTILGTLPQGGCRHCPPPAHGGLGRCD